MVQYWTTAAYQEHVAVSMTGKKCDRISVPGFLFSSKLQSAQARDTSKISCVASVTQLLLSHTPSARVFTGWFTQRAEMRDWGYCRRRLMGQVMNCLRRRSHRNRNPLSDRGCNERLCLESSKFKFQNLTNKKHLAFILRERLNLRSWLLIKNPSVATVVTASGRQIREANEKITCHFIRYKYHLSSFHH